MNGEKIIKVYKNKKKYTEVTILNFIDFIKRITT